jgi:HEAT repeat protein
MDTYSLSQQIGGLLMTDHIEEALHVFTDPSRSENEREKALELLKGNPTDRVTSALIASLHEPDSGIRWAAGNVLAEMGDAALKPLLLELASARNDLNLRNAAIHIFHTSHSDNVRSRTASLQKVLKGPGARAQIASMEEANKLLIALR